MKNLDKHADFYEAVDMMVSGGSTHLEAIIQWCHDKKLEIEAVVPLVSKNTVLLSHLQGEAQDLNFLPKSAKLPVS